MKCIFVVLALVALAHAEEWTVKTSDEVKHIRYECVKENSLTPEYLNNLKNFEYPDEEPIRKYLLCTALKMNVFSHEHGYYPERVVKQFKMDMDESEVLSIVEGCIDKNEQGSPDDVWTFRAHKCFMASKIGEKLLEIIKQKQAAATH